MLYFSFPKTLRSSSRIWNSREGYPVMKFSIFIHPVISTYNFDWIPPNAVPLRTTVFPSPFTRELSSASRSKAETILTRNKETKEEKQWSKEEWLHCRVYILRRRLIPLIAWCCHLWRSGRGGLGSAGKRRHWAGSSPPFPTVCYHPDTVFSYPACLIMKE